MIRILRQIFLLLAVCGLLRPASADLGDPQLKTDHPWYPGELACSTFDRLFQTQAQIYQRVTGRPVTTDQDRALASWLWRNTHYFHGEEGAENLWGQGFTRGDLRTREYWTGLFAHGFGLCGTTHSQWTAEFEYLLGHARGRGVGVRGHNAFEAYLTGGDYGEGKWALVDHDLSTVIFNAEGTALLSAAEIVSNWRRLTDRAYLPSKQNGWLVAGLHPDDGAVYQEFNTVEYLAGYASVPPIIRLRKGESLRRWYSPGLDDGKTFVFWGRNYMTEGIPGPERSLTWVYQPDKMHRSTKGVENTPGQARYGNAVYTFKPDFKNGGYREAVIEENERSVTFEFYTPYMIGATPPNNQPWGIYDSGGRNGLVLESKVPCKVAISVDQGQTWRNEELQQRLDLTDAVKGYRQYWLRLEAAAAKLADSELHIRTVCQANAALFPHLIEGGSEIKYESSGLGVLSVGPTKAQAKAHLVAGSFDSPIATLRLKTPRGEEMAGLHAAAHFASGNPPDPKVNYQIEYSLDGGKSWESMVRGWNIPRRGIEPSDFWSQSFCYGSHNFPSGQAGEVLVRFSNTGRRNILRGEAHLVYRCKNDSGARIGFGWLESGENRTAWRNITAGAEKDNRRIPTGNKIKMQWVEIKPDE